MAECTWIPISQGVSASQLVYGAVNHDNTNLYIGRATFNGELTPGKILSDLKTIHISYGGNEYALGNFEVLINDAEFIWLPASNGEVPENAVIGGQTVYGEKLYVVRAKHLYLTIPGKVCPSHKCAYVPCDWREHTKVSYEVLVRLDSKKTALTESKPEPLPEPEKLVSPGFEWVKYTEELGWPENAVIGGYCIDGCEQKDQFIARAKHNSNLIIGYAYKDGIFHGTSNGNEIQTECYEIFVKK